MAARAVLVALAAAGTDLDATALAVPAQAVAALASSEPVVLVQVGSEAGAAVQLEAVLASSAAPDELVLEPSAGHDEDLAAAGHDAQSEGAVAVAGALADAQEPPLPPREHPTCCPSRGKQLACFGGLAELLEPKTALATTALAASTLQDSKPLLESTTRPVAWTQQALAPRRREASVQPWCELARAEAQHSRNVVAALLREDAQQDASFRVQPRLLAVRCRCEYQPANRGRAFLQRKRS